MQNSPVGWLNSVETIIWKGNSKGQDNELFVYKMKVNENDVTRTGVQRIGNV